MKRFISKRFISVLLMLCLMAAPLGAFGAEEGLRVVAVCGSEDIQVGDQFLVRVMIDGDNDGYLTYSVAGGFDPSVAELIAPVYKDDGFSIIYNDFSNETGKFQFDAADLSLNGSGDNLLCSLLFEAKAPGEFTLKMGRPDERKPVMVGRLRPLGNEIMYDVASEDLTLTVGEPTGRESAVIIKEKKPVTPYNDMDGFEWAEIQVGALNRLGILKGIADGDSFEPDKSITRGEFVAMLMRAAKITGGDELFPDVAKDHPFAAEIAAAKKKGIALGSSDGRFNPDATVTRQDITAFVYRTLHLLDKMDEAPLEVLADFRDSGEISDYALPTMASVVRAKLLQGDGEGNLAPGKNMTRAEAAVLIERVIVHIKLVL